MIEPTRNQKPGVERTIPEAIVYGVSMIVLSLLSTALIGVVFGVLVGVFVRAYRWAIHL